MLTFQTFVLVYPYMVQGTQPVKHNSSPVTLYDLTLSSKNRYHINFDDVMYCIECPYFLLRSLPYYMTLSRDLVIRPMAMQISLNLSKPNSVPDWTQWVQSISSLVAVTALSQLHAFKQQHLGPSGCNCNIIARTGLPMHFFAAFNFDVHPYCF